MSIIAVMPIKLINERCPGKNTRLLGGKPLLQHELDNLKQTALVDRICVFCSDEAVVPFLPEGVDFVKRPRYLDLPTSNFTQIFQAFQSEHPADIYVYAHATAPYITVGTMKQCIEAVKSGNYDSAFCGLDFSLDLPAYLKELRELKEMYRGQIRLKIGVELGLQNRIRPYLESFMKEYGEAFDFIIGSSHFVDRIDPYDGAYWQNKTFE